MSTTVIEVDPIYVGGISRTTSYKDFLFDIGGHRFFSKSSRWSTFGKIICQMTSSNVGGSRIYYNGSFYSYPLKACEALNNLGYVELARCVLSYLYKQAFQTPNPASFHDWVANQFGERLFSSSSKAIRRRCGVWVATRSPPIGQRNVSRA